MAKIILDKDLDTEKEYSVDSFYEHLINGYCNATKCVKVAVGSVFPFVPVPSGTKFESIQLSSDGGIEIPILGNYNTIEEMRIDYHEVEQSYDLTMVFVYSEDEVNANV